MLAIEHFIFSIPTDHTAGEKNITDKCIGRNYELYYLNIDLDLS